MAKSLAEFAKDTPIKGWCLLCQQVGAGKVMDELNAGLDAGIPTAMIVRWLDDEHDIQVHPHLVSNHKRGYGANPSRHQGIRT